MPDHQVKLVRSKQGVIFDVAVDIWRSSTNFGQWALAILSTQISSSFECFVYGFLTLINVDEVHYKARGFWIKDCERSIRWHDPELAIHWPLDQLEGAAVSLSEKDAEAPSFKPAVSVGDVFQ